MLKRKAHTFLLKAGWPFPITLPIRHPLVLDDIITSVVLSFTYPKMIEMPLFRGYTGGWTIEKERK